LEVGIVKTSLRYLALFAAAAAAPLLSAAQATKADPKAILDWTQFRGPKRDGISPETGLLKQWPAAGPALAWKATGIGVGKSSVCASGKFVFTTGEAMGKCQLVCIGAVDGKVLWKLPFGSSFDNNQAGPGPSSTPATDGNLVIAIGSNGEMICAQAATGRQVWTAKMQGLGANQPGFGFCESPLIDGNFVLVSPGGSVTALSKLNGKQVWKSKKLKGETDYSSLGIAEMGKVKQYLVMTSKSAAGVLATNGAVLWEGDYTGEAQGRPMVPTPVYDNGTVFIAAGYGVGCKGFKVAVKGAQIVFQDAFEGKQLEVHHGGMIAHDGHVYGLHDQGTLRCIKLETGEMVWQGRATGKGSIAMADGHLYCRGEDGSVALVEASPAGFKEKGRFTPPERGSGRTWAHPAISGGKLYLREGDSLFAYNVKE
jgi:outer membrane protein assembly factor BamB